MWQAGYFNDRDREFHRTFDRHFDRAARGFRRGDRRPSTRGRPSRAGACIGIRRNRSKPDGAVDTTPLRRKAGLMPAPLPPDSGGFWLDGWSVLRRPTCDGLKSVPRSINPDISCETVSAYRARNESPSLRGVHGGTSGCQIEKASLFALCDHVPTSPHPFRGAGGRGRRGDGGLCPGS